MKRATVDICSIQLIDAEINQKSKVKEDSAIIYTPSCHCEPGLVLIKFHHIEEQHIAATSMNRVLKQIVSGYITYGFRSLEI